jgi:hypothetical protein
MDDGYMTHIDPLMVTDIDGNGYAIDFFLSVRRSKRAALDLFKKAFYKSRKYCTININKSEACKAAPALINFHLL